VIAIIGLLVALLFPDVQTPREAARPMTSEMSFNLRYAVRFRLAFSAGLALALGLPAQEDPVPVLHAGPPTVLMIDSYERLQALDTWLREDFLPQLPDSTLTIIAGRAAPGPAWLAEPGWQDLVRVFALRNLDPDSKDVLEIGQQGGANLAWGGERLNRETEGFYLSPALFTVALSLGLRQGECIGLQWSEVDLEAGRLTVPKYGTRIYVADIIFTDLPMEADG
jgi:hypothetical protein